MAIYKGSWSHQLLSWALFPALPRFGCSAVLCDLGLIVDLSLKSSCMIHSFSLILMMRGDSDALGGERIWSGHVILTLDVWYNATDPCNQRVVA